MIKQLKKPAVIGYLILLIGFIVAFQVGVNARNEAKRKGCLSIVAAYDLVADAVTILTPTRGSQQIDPALPDSVKALIEKSQKNALENRQKFEIRLNEPIPLCQSVGIDQKIQLGEGNDTLITYREDPNPVIVIQRIGRENKEKDLR